MNEYQVAAAAKLIEQASSIIISAGSGMGVDSGLPDFRGPYGLWKEHPIYEKYGLSFLDLASPTLLEKDPELFWGFYGYRHNLYKNTTPHLGFDFIHKWARSKNCFVITSNVDGHFQKAGFEEEKVWEVHGSIHWNQKSKTFFDLSKEFVDGKAQYEDVIPAVKVEVNNKTMKAKNIPSKDGELLRPNILMFGDYGWNVIREEKQKQNFNQWAKDANLNKLVLIEIGAGTQLPTLRNINESLVKKCNGTLIRINPNKHESHCNHIKSISMQGTALGAIARISQALKVS